MNPSQEQSNERAMYDALFPSAQKATLIRSMGISFEQLKVMFPERVLLVRLDEIFSAWKAANDARPVGRQISMAYPVEGTQAVIIYDYDHWKYRSTVYQIDPENVPQVEIKLSNDGFIYPSRDTLSLNQSYDTTAPHQKPTGWCRLSDDTIRAHFPAILAGCKSILGTPEGELIQGKVLYHEIHECVDFMFEKSDKSARVLITFEPGYPEHFHNNDPWGTF